MKEDNFKAVCIYCGRTDRETSFNREDIIPKNIGGKLFLDNCVCKDDNSLLGSKVDVEILKLPDILNAFEILKIPHDRDGIIRQHYKILGEAEGVLLRHGRIVKGGYFFPEQRLSDGSLLAPEKEYFQSLQRIIARDKRLLDEGLTWELIQEKLFILEADYERLEPGKQIECPELGLILRKRSLRPRISVTPVALANVHPLIVKIAYEFLFLYFEVNLFRDENYDLFEQLRISALTQKIEPGIFIARIDPETKEPRPVHFVRCEFHPNTTIIQVVFFGSIAYCLFVKSVSGKTLSRLRTQLEIDDLNAIDYQQDLQKKAKSFWVLRKNGEISLLYGSHNP